MGGSGKNKLFEVQIFKQLKNNYSLYPMFFIGCLGIGLASFSIVRTLLRSPDVQIDRRGNPAPYEKLIGPDGKYVQYKYFTTLDYNKMSETNERPKL